MDGAETLQPNPPWTGPGFDVPVPRINALPEWPAANSAPRITAAEWLAAELAVNEAWPRYRKLPLSERRRAKLLSPALPSLAPIQSAVQNLGVELPAVALAQLVRHGAAYTKLTWRLTNSYVVYANHDPDGMYLTVAAHVGWVSQGGNGVT